MSEHAIELMWKAGAVAFLLLWFPLCGVVGWWVRRRPDAIPEPVHSLQAQIDFIKTQMDRRPGQMIPCSELELELAQVPDGCIYIDAPNCRRIKKLLKKGTPFL